MGSLWGVGGNGLHCKPGSKREEGGQMFARGYLGTQNSNPRQMIRR
jgi:hypothetical protein